MLSEPQIAHVQKTGMFSLFTDFEHFSTFAPTEMQADSADQMLPQLLAWTKAMETERADELVSV